MTNLTVLLIIAVFPALAIVAVFINYRLLLKRKGNEANRLLSGETMKRYGVLYGSLTPGEPNAPYHSTRSFLLPLAANALLTWAVTADFVLVTRIFHPARDWSQLGVPVLPATVMAGFAGAYFWVFYDLIDRYARIDLTPRAMYVGLLRFGLGGALGYLLGLTLKNPIDLLGSFAVAALPVESLRKLLRQIASEKFGLKEHIRQTEAPNLQFIQGMTPETIERLEEEGIRSAQDLASANPIKLFLRTNIEMTNILELVDQALLFLYVGERIQELRAVGFRGAIELTDIDDLLSSSDTDDARQGKALAELLSQKVQQPLDGVINLVQNLNLDPRVGLLLDLWGDTYREWRDPVTGRRHPSPTTVPMVTHGVESS